MDEPKPADLDDDLLRPEPLREPSRVDDGAPMPPGARAAHEAFDERAEAAAAELDSSGQKPDKETAESGRKSDGATGEQQRPLVTIYLPMDMRAAAEIMLTVAKHFPDAVMSDQDGTVIHVLRKEST